MLRDSSPDSELVLIDFGSSDVFNFFESLDAANATIYYTAPEILLNEPYNEKWDVWSVGLILYMMLCGFSPYLGEHDEEVF